MSVADYLDETTRKLIVRFQREEITGAEIYRRMAKRETNPQNKETLQRIAVEETKHAGIWQWYSDVEVKVSRFQLLWYSLMAWLLGYTFTIKMMERNETFTASEYQRLVDQIPELRGIIAEEEAHEAMLQTMLDEERLRYVGAMVLGLNDALVELTGTIAGLTLALADTKIVAVAGIITGVSATLSMAASNYLAERADGKADAFKSCLYTGVAYLITVVLLVMPYLLYPDDMYIAALFTMLLIVIAIIFAFNYYIAIAKSLPFLRRFLEMACISLSVAVISFIIGLVAKYFLGVDL